MSAPPTLLVGTAGHIDHGKSRLVQALTGTNPDRLPEEQARGMTIDLGFAHVAGDDCTLSFVDVPGHERFIRNMVAGATGIDLALLVVAADDSVMPQTREHAEVLAWLGVRRCVVAITKMDLVDAEWAEQIEEEARALLMRLGLEPLAVVRTSAETGAGVDELRGVLCAAARQTPRDALPYRWFRLPIDRSFSVAGRGTVVTGSVAHGGVERDTELELLPAQRPVRVRDLQSHHTAQTATAGRTRLALNLAALATHEVTRGNELATPGYLTPTRVLDVWLTSLRMPGKTRPQTLRLRLHMGTGDQLVELRLPEKPAGERVTETFAQLRVQTPVVATWGQHFIVRDEAATRTLGGGWVLRPIARRWTTRRPAHATGLAILRDGSAAQRLEETIRDADWQVVSDAQLAARAGLADAPEAARLVRSALDRGRAVALTAGQERSLLHVEPLNTLVADVRRRLTAHLEANPRSAGVPRQEWPGWMPRACPAKLRVMLAERLLADGHVAAVNECIVPPGYRGALSADDQRLYDALLGEFAAAGFAPPAFEELACRTAQNEGRLRELFDLAIQRGALVKVTATIWLHATRWEELVRRVTTALRAAPAGLTLSEIRQQMGSSRKYMVPICERLDAAGITKRQGDRRTPGPRAPT